MSELRYTGHLLVGAVALVLGVILTVIAFQQDLDSPVFTIVSIASAIPLVVALQFFVQGVRRWRAARTAARYGSVEWAAICVKPENHYLIRLLLVDPAAGLLLLTLSGRQLAAWPWADIGPAHATTVDVGGRSKSGLIVDAQPIPQFAFLSPSGIGYSREIAARGAQAISAHAGPAR